MRIGVTNLAAKFTVEGNLAEDLVQFIFRTGGLSQLHVQNSHRNVRGGNANSVTGQLALQLGECLRNSTRRTGFGNHHVQHCRTAAAITLVEVIDQVLIIRESVHGLHVTAFHTVHIIKNLQCGGNRVGRAGCRRKNLIVVGNDAIVHAEDNILHIALTGSGQQNAGNTGALKVLGQPRNIAPAAGVIDQKRILNTVLGVIHSGRI